MRNNSDTCAAPSAKNTHKGLDIFKLPPHPLPREQHFRPFCFESEASAVAFMFTYFKQATHTERSRSFKGESLTDVAYTLIRYSRPPAKYEKVCLC